MSKHIYANLAPMGWVDLSSDPNCVISRNFSSPNTWYSEGGILDSLPSSNLSGKLEEYPFVNLTYKGSDYRVSPFNFQIVTTD